jgi:hypothetical protein
MKAHYRTITTLAATLLVVTLASCGGSGVSSSGSTGSGYQGVVTNPPAVTYPPGENLNVSNAVTAIRQGAGPGLFIQNTALDTAATSHASFLVNNNLLLPGYLNVLQAGSIYGAHFENSAFAGFTGASPQLRATAAGYLGTVSEVMTFGAPTGTACVDSLANSVYHLIALISPFIDVGISFNPGIGSGSACAVLLGVGSNTLGQLPASPVFYPYNLQTGVPPNYYNSAEVPDPASDLTAPLGHPVAVSLYTLANPVLNGGDIVINAFSITPSGGAALPVRVLANTGVTTTGPALTVDNLIPRAGFVVLLPLAPLAASTLHNVSFSATVKGQLVSNNWSFTTGAAN